MKCIISLKKKRPILNAIFYRIFKTMVAWIQKMIIELKKKKEYELKKG